jgi:hypothetical protein
MNNFQVVTLQVGNKYGDHYVHALRRSLKSFGHTLVVLGQEYPLPVLPLEGWYWKTYLFSKDLQDDLGPIFWLDLDTVIMSDIDWVVVDKFMCLRSAWHPDEWGSGVMTIPQGTGHKFWELVAEHPELAMKYHGGGIRFGDQGLIRRAGDEGMIQHDGIHASMLQHRWPGKLASYKNDIVQNNVDPESTSIVFFHGLPRPHHVLEPWMAHFHEGRECTESS